MDMEKCIDLINRCLLVNFKMELRMGKAILSNQMDHIILAECLKIWLTIKMDITGHRVLSIMEELNRTNSMEKQKKQG